MKALRKMYDYIFDLTGIEVRGEKLPYPKNEKCSKGTNLDRVLIRTVLKFGFSPYSVITFVFVINFAGVLNQIDSQIK